MSCFNTTVVFFHVILKYIFLNKHRCLRYDTIQTKIKFYSVNLLKTFFYNSNTLIWSYLLTFRYFKSCLYKLYFIITHRKVSLESPVSLTTIVFLCSGKYYLSYCKKTNDRLQCCLKWFTYKVNANIG